MNMLVKEGKLVGAHAAITDGKKEFIVAYLDIGITKVKKK